MLLLFDIAPEAIAEHDDWHSREHLPERLAIPGFLRSTRWIATEGAPRYLIVYEVADLAVLTSDAYLARLNAPSRWTSALMPHYRGMRRGFCTVSASLGSGTGHLARLLRFAPIPGREASLRAAVVDTLLPRVPATPGGNGAHLLEGTATPPMTHEQRLRGADAGIGWALLATGFRDEALRAIVARELAAARGEGRGLQREPSETRS